MGKHIYIKLACLKTADVSGGKKRLRLRKDG